MPDADLTPSTALRNAVRAFMRARMFMSEHDMRGRILALVSETVEEELREHRELAAARPGDKPADPVAALVSTALDTGPITVREKRNYGGCDVMGVLVRETRTGFTYTDGEGRTRRSVRRARRQFAGERLPEPHTAPCSECPENRDPNACIHGRGREETCESCLCM